MKLKHYLLLFLIIFVISMSNAFADTSYNNSGSESQDYLVGTGIFNQNLVTSIINSRSFGNDISNIPLVADLDGDGTNEIIITLGNKVRIIDTDLVSIASITLSAGSYTIPVLSDIDNDGFTEIILANEEESNITILKYDGTNFLLNKSFSVPHEAITGTERGMIGCNDGEDGTEGIKCLFVIALSTYAVGQRNLTAILFNATDIGSNVILQETSLTNIDFCLPQIPMIAVADYDADGRDEFIFTFTAFSGGADEVLTIYYVNDSFDLAYSNEQTGVFSSGYNPASGAGVSCDDDNTPSNVGNFYTSPLVANVNGETGLEVIVGLNNDAQDFRIHVFDVDGDEIDRHPSFFEADGEIISNVMLANVFGDTGTIDYCVLGHDDDDEQINLLCGSQETGNIVQSIEFKYNTDGRYNVTKDFPKQNVISHMAQHSNLQVDIEGEGETDTTELMTSFGVFRLNDDTFNGSFFIKNLDLIYTNIVGDSACIQVDAQEQGSEEIICIEGNQIFYINDGVDNAPAEITEVTYSPCVVDSIIKINETLQVLVTVTDQNPSPLSQDTVSSNVSIYFGDANQLSSSVENTASGALHPHSFTLNKTITGGTIKIEGWDSENSDTRSVKTQSFTVGLNGIEFGDSTCTLEFVPEAEEAAAAAAEADLTTDADDNAITNSLTTLIGLTGLGGTTIWRFFMMIATILIWFEGMKVASGNAILGTIAIFNVLAILLGARLGILSTGLVVTITVLGIVIIGVFLGRFFKGDSSTAE